MNDFQDFALISQMKYMSQVFRFLRGGEYLCAHTPDHAEQLWFEEVNSNFKLYEAVFQTVCGEKLVRKDGYYHLAAVPSDNKDLKKKQTVDDYNRFIAAMKLIYLTGMTNVAPGNDRLRFSTIQSLFENNPDAFAICRQVLDSEKKIPGTNEAAFYAQKFFDLLINRLKIMRASGEGQSTIYIIQDSYNRFKELTDQLKLHNVSDEDIDDPFKDLEVQAMLNLYATPGEKESEAGISEKPIDEKIDNTEPISEQEQTTIE